MDGFLAFLENNSLYIVLFIVLTIWVGVYTYMNVLDKRLQEIESELKESNNEE